MRKTKVEVSDYLTDEELKALQSVKEARTSKEKRDNVSIRNAIKTVLCLDNSLDEDVLFKFLTPTERVVYKAIHSEQASQKPVDSIKTYSSLLGEDKVTLTHELGASGNIFLGIHREDEVESYKEDVKEED